MPKEIKRDRNLLGTENINTLFWSYCIPAIVATTAGSLYNIIDRIFIGKEVGAMAISGLGLTFPIMNLAVAFGTLVGAGASARVSILMGEKKRADATRTLGNALLLNFIIGISFSIVGLIFLDPILYLFGANEHTIPYAHDFMQVILAGNLITHVFFGLNNIMRASGYPTKAMISILLTVIVNVILAPIFIFHFKMGIRGAAIATIISQSIGLIWVMAHFMDKKSIIHFQPAGFKFNKKIVGNIFAIGMSPFLINACACSVAIIMNKQLERFSGDLAIGAFSIINSIAGLIVMVIFGFTQGMQPIVGFNYGARQKERMMKAFSLTVLWATIIAVGGFLAALIFPHPIARAFTSDAEQINITVNGLRLYMIAFPFIGFQIVTSHFFQSIGKAKIAIWLSLTRQVLCLIPLLYLLPLFWKLNGVWCAAAAADFISFIITAIGLFYFISINSNPNKA